MADPTLQTFCCVETNSTRPGADTILRLKFGPYNVVCIVFSIFGILGGIYQVLPRGYRYGLNRRPSSSILRGRYIITWLATADLLGSSAVLIRSLSWIFTKSLDSTNFSMDTAFCAVTSGFIQYFYTATCLWTLCYAFDVFRVIREEIGMPRIYHAISWGLPSVLTFVGLFILYYPSFDCHDMRSDIYTRVLPNYLFTYVPIGVIMIANPMLYWTASKSAEEVVASVSGVFTHTERKQLNILRLKFLSIILVFYLCWLPNLINSFLLWIMWDDVPRNFLIFDWYLMAILNPLQALLNALVYRKWGDDRSFVRFPWRRFSQEQEAEASYILDADDAFNPKENSDDKTPPDSFNGYGSL